MITVLVVDDDPSIRNMIALTLEEKGLSVVTAASGREAMSLWRCHVGGFDLLLSDIVMGDLDGLTLARTLRTSEPALPVILMSGTSVPSWPRAFGSIEFLPKPFSCANLLDCVRSLVNTSNEPEAAVSRSN